MDTIPEQGTQRLIMRGEKPEDFGCFHRMLQNREVLRFLTRTDPWPEHVVEYWLASQAAHWQAHRFGWWILEEKEAGDVLGWYGLRRLQETGEVELLYLLRREDWGKGFATEAAEASVAYALEFTSLTSLVGLVHPENHASVRILEKVGMAHIGESHYFGMRLLKYRLEWSVPSDSKD